jgi:ABC-type branched-subunit amino acid transport system substrate-binding protein
MRLTGLFADEEVAEDVVEDIVGVNSSQESSRCLQELTATRLPNVSRTAVRPRVRRHSKCAI